jgi:hypothetical protein
MALMDDLVAQHFDSPDDLHTIVLNLDLGLFSVAVGVKGIRDTLLHGSPGSPSSGCDPQEVAASAEALLSYVGRLGVLIDRLEAGTNPFRQLADEAA